MINFKAHTINSVNLERIHISKKASKYKGHFVELDIDSAFDYKALHDVGLGWNRGRTLAGDIFDLFSTEKYCKSKKFSTTPKFFAIIKNNACDKLLNGHDILGIATLTEEKDKTHYLKYIQIDPDHQYNSLKRRYKHIGKALIESIQKLPYVKEISLYAENLNLESYYTKLNFKKEKNSPFMIFKR